MTNLKRQEIANGWARGSNKNAKTLWRYTSGSSAVTKVRHRGSGRQKGRTGFVKGLCSGSRGSRNVVPKGFGAFIIFSCPAVCDFLAFKMGMTNRLSPFANNVLPFALNLRGAAHIRK